MILEKLSNKVNPKKKYIDLPGNWKQKRSADKIWVHWEKGVEGRGEREG